MTDEDATSMQESHSSFVEHIINDPPALNFETRTRGIVTSAGRAYFPVFLVSLIMLRRNGSALPVEIFLSTESEYESQACSTTFPALNAKCLILSTFLTNPTPNFSMENYQIKIFAILFSSFEEVLFLDADNFPVHPPEQLFTSEPFISNHLILWPDYWTPTFSPYFTNISSLPPSILSSRPAIEAGQILVSKPKHVRTLMLAAYYNAYSEYVYHLITQGGPGEGDKDTFAAAALVLNASFYTVRHAPVPLGMRGDGAVVLQFDPIVDYMDGMEEKPFFIHASWPPKLNPLRNVRSERQWGSEETSRARFEGMDVERVAWGFMVEMACSEGLELGGGVQTSVVVESEGAEMGLCERTRGIFRKMFGWECVRGKVE
jgi:alpha 1,2-mannosyltransferase